MPNIRRPHDPDGEPWGTYDVFYYQRKTSKGGTWFKGEAGYSREVNHGFVERLTVAPLEVAIATCKDQSGGVTIFGCAQTEREWDAWQKRLEAEEKDDGTAAIRAAAMAYMHDHEHRQREARDANGKLTITGAHVWHELKHRFSRELVEREVAEAIRIMDADRPHSWLYE